MADLHALAALKRRIDEEPAITLERAAQTLGISPRTLRRRIHEFEVRRGPNRHIFVTVRSVTRYLVQEQYQATRDFDLTRSVKY